MQPNIPMAPSAKAICTPGSQQYDKKDYAGYSYSEGIHACLVRGISKLITFSSFPAFVNISIKPQQVHCYGQNSYIMPGK